MYVNLVIIIDKYPNLATMSSSYESRGHWSILQADSFDIIVGGENSKILF
jgi:hypothetical protein